MAHFVHQPFNVRLREGRVKSHVNSSCLSLECKDFVQTIGWVGKQLLLLLLLLGVIKMCWQANIQANLEI